MLPSMSTAGVLGGGLRPLAHSGLPAHSLLGSLAPLPLPFTTTSVASSMGGVAAPFVVESLLRERAASHLARPVATKPPVLLPDDPRQDHFYYKDDPASHYLQGLLARPAGPDRLTPPPPATQPSPPRSRDGGEEGCGCDGDGPPHSPASETSSKPHLKFSVTAILGHDAPPSPPARHQDQHDTGDLPSFAAAVAGRRRPFALPETLPPSASPRPFTLGLFSSSLTPVYVLSLPLSFMSHRQSVCAAADFLLIISFRPIHSVSLCESFQPFSRF